MAFARAVEVGEIGMLKGWCLACFLGCFLFDVTCVVRPSRQMMSSLQLEITVQGLRSRTAAEQVERAMKRSVAILVG